MAIGLRDAVARAAALAVARREAPVLPGADERQPVTGCRRPEVVALVHRDEKVGRAGDVGEPDRRPDPARLDAQVAPVGQERHDGRGIRRGRRARIAGRGDAEHEPPARDLTRPLTSPTPSGSARTVRWRANAVPSNPE